MSRPAAELPSSSGVRSNSHRTTNRLTTPVRTWAVRGDSSRTGINTRDQGLSGWRRCGLGELSLDSRGPLLAWRKVDVTPSRVICLAATRHVPCPHPFLKNITPAPGRNSSNPKARDRGTWILIQITAVSRVVSCPTERVESTACGDRGAYVRGNHVECNFTRGSLAA